MYKSNLPSEWGTLFGLSPKDLTDEQLSKITFPKLVEFLGIDSIIESIVSTKIFEVPVKELHRLGEIEENLDKLESFKVKYNECLKVRRKDIDNNKDYYYGRNKIVMWNLLDDENKQHEFELWTAGYTSSINEDILDFEWLYTKNKEFADTVVEKLLNRKSYSSANAIRNMIGNIPKDDYLRWLPKIFEKDKYTFIHSLSNINTPDEYILKSLRAIAKLTHPPSIRVKINNTVLNELPPVTRLEVLEKIVYSCNRNNLSLPLTDVKNEDDLKQLVFSSTTRHYDRVTSLVSLYSKMNNKLVNWSEK